MIRAGAALALVLLGALAPVPARAAPGAVATPVVARFAIVIGNNTPESDDAPTLRYADDDAVATHRLFLEAGVESLLLVRLDPDSAGLYPNLARRPPRGQELDDAFATVSLRMRHQAAMGQATELLLFYSGHGDVDGGEGYVVLEDRRLTRSMLYDLLARSPATRNHVVIDACKSYFLAFEKGPGGRRSSYARSFVNQAIPARLANTGFLLSTSSDRDSHEWERYQAGILSHELRSALRGGADADADGGVTYAELGAFVATANQSIDNPRFRPDFFVRPPEQNLASEMLRWSPATAAVRLERGPIGHVYVESARGDRLLDANPDGDQSLTFHLPAERPLFVRKHDESAEFVVTGRELVSIAALRPSAPEIAHKGALHLAFGRLFAAPFGARTVRAFAGLPEPVALSRPAPPAPAPRAPGSSRRRVLSVAALSVAAAATAGGAVLSLLAARKYYGGDGAPQVEIADRNQSVHRLNVASIVCYAIAGAVGLTWAATRVWPAPTLALTPEVAADGRARGVTLLMQRRF